MLGEILTFQRGYDLPKAKMKNGIYPVIGSSGIIGYHNEYTTEAPSITIGRSGSVGKPFLYKGKSWSHNTALYVKEYKNADPIFIYYFLQSLNLGHYAGGSAVPTLNRNHIHSLPVIIPPLNVQEKIAAILSSLDDKIEINRRINENLENQARAIFRDWFIDRETSEHGKKGKLKDILILKRRNIKASEKKDLPYLPMNVIPMRSFAVHEVRPNDEANSSLVTFSRDDIIIGAIRVYFHRVILAPFDGITHTTCFTLRPFDDDYLSFCLLYCDLDSTIKYAENISTGTTMPSVTWNGGLGDMDIIIPDKKIVRDFNHIVLPMLRKIQASYRENESLAQIREALLPKLISGEIIP